VISPLTPLHAYEALAKASKQYLPDIPIRKSTLLTKADIPFRGSPELALMWTEYLRTRSLRDINEITRPDDAKTGELPVE
jgi:hypothetical protein